MGTDVGFTLNRYIQGSVNQAFFASSSPALDPDSRSQLMKEDSEPSSDNESLSGILQK